MAEVTAVDVSLDIAHKYRDSLLAHLQAKGIPFERFDHVPVHTVEEQAKYVGDANGVLTKNLLLKDKKGRLLLVTALTATKIDLKALSARLGLGKGGLRMAPPEALAQVLQVPPGSCSPLALWQSGARQVGLLLDGGFESHPRLLCHPLTNDASLALSTQALRAFLASIDRRAHFVDLEAEPLVGRDQPPDLADCLAELGATPTAAPSGSLPAGPPSTPPCIIAPSHKAVVQPLPPPDNVGVCSQRLLERVMAALPAEAAASLSEEWKKETALSLHHPLVMFKNAAYAHGWVAGKSVP